MKTKISFLKWIPVLYNWVNSLIAKVFNVYLLTLKSYVLWSLSKFVLKMLKLNWIIFYDISVFILIQPLNFLLNSNAFPVHK